MSEEAKKILEAWYNQFRSDFLADHDDASENDCEVAFLQMLHPAVDDANAAGDYGPAEIREALG